MKRALLAAAGSALVVGVVFAGHHGVVNPPAIHIPQAVHHQYSLLTPAQKLASVQLFKLKSSPTNGTPPTYTLTPQIPFVAGVNASLNAAGSWLTGPTYNQIIFTQPNVASYAQVFISNPSPTAAQTVTFNITISGNPQTFFLDGSQVINNSFVMNPIVPTITLSAGSYSVPISLPPGYNVAELQFANSAGPATVYLDSVTVQQY